MQISSSLILTITNPIHLQLTDKHPQIILDYPFWLVFLKLRIIYYLLDLIQVIYSFVHFTNNATFSTHFTTM